MCDLDSQTLLEIALKRLANPELQIEKRSVFVARSGSEGHYHLIVRLVSPRPLLWRMLFQLYLMDQVYRSVKNFDRALRNSPAPSLLISPENWKCNAVTLNSTRFWRNPDAICHCPQAKHKSPKAILTCPAHLRLRGK